MGRVIQRTARAVGVASTAAVALILADACSVPAGEAMMRAGDAMIDAGSAVGDGGQAPGSTGGADASPTGVRGDGGAEGGSLMADAGMAMRDAGSALIDAGNAVHDAGADAMAQVVSLFRSGSRIEVRVGLSKGADGSQAAGYPSLYDTQLGAGCAVSVAADGKRRCVPMGVSVTYFEDSNCTAPLALDTTSPCAGGAPKYAQRYETVLVSGCSTSVIRVFMVGAPYTGKVYGGSVASCVDVTASVPQGWRPYHLGPEVPPASFVEFTDGGHEVLK